MQHEKFTQCHYQSNAIHLQPLPTKPNPTKSAQKKHEANDYHASRRREEIKSSSTGHSGHGSDRDPALESAAPTATERASQCEGG